MWQIFISCQRSYTMCQSFILFAKSRHINFENDTDYFEMCYFLQCVSMRYCKMILKYSAMIKTCFHHSCLCNISISIFTYQCSSMFVLTFAYKYSGFLSTLTHHVLYSCYKIFNAKESWAFPLTLPNKRQIWDLRVVLPIFSFAMQLSLFFNEIIFIYIPIYRNRYTILNLISPDTHNGKYSGVSQNIYRKSFVCLSLSY